MTRAITTASQGPHWQEADVEPEPELNQDTMIWDAGVLTSIFTPRLHLCPGIRGFTLDHEGQERKEVLLHSPQVKHWRASTHFLRQIGPTTEGAGPGYRSYPCRTQAGRGT